MTGSDAVIGGVGNDDISFGEDAASRLLRCGEVDGDDRRADFKCFVGVGG